MTPEAGKLYDISMPSEPEPREFGGVLRVTQVTEKVVLGHFFWVGCEPNADDIITFDISKDGVIRYRPHTPARHLLSRTGQLRAG